MPNLAPFPVEGLLPKEATEATKFLAKFPKYDGRGIRVGVLDTGIDPAARGLDGKGKVVDVIDCSGAGDVPLTKVEPSNTTSEGIELISPTSGRKIIVVSGAAKDSPYLLGFKRAYELWPKDLIARRKQQRQRNWDVENAKVVAKVQRELADLEESPANPETKKETISAQKEELKAQLDVLKSLSSSYEDPGPLLESVTYFDGKHWRTVVGGAEGDIRESTVGLSDGECSPLSGQALDLRKTMAMADFHLEHQHDAFGPADLLTYSVNHIFEGTDAKTPSAVSLVTVSGSHGTHCASITGADHGDGHPENGVAPGVEIVSLRIGDGRLAGMETGQALLRAAQALISTGCHIANMSFGEDGAFGLEGKGAFAEALRDYVIRKKDILFVSSAGNSAPALTTLGHPAGTTEGVFTIGAYVNAGSMQQAEYALIEKDVTDHPTTWSSRGPASDGARGTTVYAPGAAITSIPKYCLSSTQLMNGTSMASPNACGVISLLLSGMKQEGIPITSARVHKAIEATAKDFGDDLGVGFIQTLKAWEYIVENKDRADADFEYRIRATPAGKTAGGSADQRGIYLREKNETSRMNQYTVNVQPLCKGTEPEKAYALQLKTTLATDAPWVSAPDFLHLGSNGRSFEVRVDPSQLPPGLHIASVKGFDSDKRGHELFDIPITVTKPIVATSPTVKYATTLKAGSIERNFLSVPEGATWAEATFRSSNHGQKGTSAKFWFHGVTLEPQRRLSAAEEAFVLALNEGEPVVKKFAVKAGQTLEVCLAEMWNASQSFNLEATFEFHGITVGQAVSGRDELTLIGGEGLAKVECLSNVRIETFKPTVSFSKRRTFVRPNASSIRPLLSDRNLHPNGKQMHELVNTYPLTISEGGSVKVSWPTSSPLSNLYDSAVPMLTAIYESATKKLVTFGDVYPKDKTLSKGEYIVKAQWLNTNPAALQNLKTATMKVDQSLSKGKDITLEAYDDHVAAFDGVSKPIKNGNIKLFPGERKVLNFNLDLHGDALPKEAQPGDVLIGQFGFAPEGKYTLRYIVAPTPKKEEENGGDKNGGKDDAAPQLPELLAPVVKKLKGDEKKTFLEELLKKYPTSLPILLARLDSLDTSKKEEAPQIISAADEIVKQIDVTKIYLYLGEKRLPASEQSEEQKKEDKKMNEQKKALVTAHVKKAKAILSQSSDGQAPPAEFKEAFESARKLLGESTDKEYANLRIANYIHSTSTDGGDQGKRLGQALQAVRKLISEFGVGDGTNKE